jgi:hypothetical protein
VRGASSIAGRGCREVLTGMFRYSKASLAFLDSAFLDSAVHAGAALIGLGGFLVFRQVLH